MSTKPPKQQHSAGMWTRTLACTFLLLCLACGGGGGSRDDEGPQAPTQHQLQAAIELALRALDTEAQRGADLEKLYVANDLAGNLIPMTRGVSAGTIVANAGDETTCITVSFEGDTQIRSYDGSPACRGVSGSLRITRVSAEEIVPGVRVTDLSLVDFDTGDGCPVNGAQRTTVSADGIHITAECTYTDLDICGRLFSGQVTLDGRTPTDWEVAMDEAIHRYPDGSEATLALRRQPADGLMRGSIAARLADGGYAMTAEAMRIDPACGLPTAGGLMITAPDGSRAGADFSTTTCDTPLVTVTRGNTTDEWPLFDAP